MSAKQSQEAVDEKSIEMLLEELNEQDRQTAFQSPRLVAKINKDRFWVVPAGSEEPLLKTETLRGHILAAMIGRALFVNEVSEKLPACASRDGGRHGTLLKEAEGQVMFPNHVALADGQACAVCPFNQFGSGLSPDGAPTRGKRCKERRNLAMLIAEFAEPVVVSLSPTSLNAWDVYASALANSRKPSSYIAVVTEISIKVIKDGTINAEYGVAQFRTVEAVPPALVLEALRNRQVYAGLLNAPAIYEQVPQIGAGPADKEEQASDELPF